MSPDSVNEFRHFENLIFCYPNSCGQGPWQLWRAVSKRCSFREQIHWLRVGGRTIFVKKCGFKNIWICIDVALEKEGPQFQACNCLNTFKFYNCPLWCWQSDQLLEGQIVKKSVAGPVTAVNAWDSNFVPLSCSVEQFKVHGLTSTLVLSPVEVLVQ